ncbi:membrane protein [Rhodoferax sp. OV413]|uniref:YihY family inner membrane protein n=1 Tax=Rhodoferax sp. OV413 TaxID=1855285 RepID=UPI00087E2CF7|nr:YihY family inner membrane protein [Rhodoferax sp. OV413]SDP45563.1 membrane protein [Rhodoferax sp. OV413]
MPLSLFALSQRFDLFLKDLSRFPWKTTAHTLRERFREDHLGLTASSLTFTTSLALVPFFTVALAIFTAFPMFGKVQVVLQKWLVQSLIPESIARQVQGYLTQFASQASKLGSVGLAIVLFTALALILTIDHTLNAIWRVRRARPLGQRVLIYWAAITLGPLLLGASLALTSYLVSSSQGVVDSLPGGVRLLFSLLQMALLATGMAALYRYVPNTRVKWSHAWAGGVFVALGIEAAKRLLTAYLAMVPTYSMVYGAFATLPILLVWIYLAWVVVLLGAVIAAYMPSLLQGVARRATTHGWPFLLAIEVLQQLHRARAAGDKGLSMPQLEQAVQVDTLQLEPVLNVLAAMDWVGRLEELEPLDGSATAREPRWLLLVDPDRTLLLPLVEQLLLTPAPALENLWKNNDRRSMYLRDVL